MLHKITRSSGISSYILALIYLPGTFLHEMAHFLSAIILFLNVRGVNLIPKITKTDDGKGYYIKLGSVQYEQTDYLRSMLVGIAPIFAGLGFFYIFFAFNIFPSDSLIINALSLYLLFSISSSMFSSKKDLEGGLILIPLFLLIFSFFIGFKISIAEILLSESLISFFERLNTYLLPASIGNFLLFVIFRIFLK